MTGKFCLFPPHVAETQPMVEAVRHHDPESPPARAVDMNATVCDAMTWTSLIVRPECLARVALETLIAAEATELFVVSDEGAFLGLLSDFELLKADLNGSLDDCTVGQLMHCRPQMLSPDQSLADAAKMFRDGGVCCVPVIREGRLLGMLQRRDVLRWLAVSRLTDGPSEVQPPKYLQVAGSHASVC